MITIWIALGPCGLDAPGLELVTQPIRELVRPELLTDRHLRSAFAPETILDTCYRQRRRRCSSLEIFCIAHTSPPT
jgi:hypothetical protein